MEDFLFSERLSRLNQAIADQYGHLAPDEIVALEENYDEAVEEVFEVVRCGIKQCTLTPMRQLHGELFHVKPPREILTLLERGDVFWAALGQGDNFWRLLYLSPHYCTRAAERWANECKG